MSGRPIRLAWICKRRYTNKDLVADRFGRLYHYPRLLAQHGFHSKVLALDYWGNEEATLDEPGAEFRAIPVGRFHLWRAYCELREAMFVYKPDVVVASGDTHLGWLGLHLAHRLGLPFVFDVYDDYRTFGTNRLPGMRRLFGQVVRQADRVLCVSETLMHRLSDINPQLTLLRNGVDVNLFRPLDKRAARATLALEQDVPVVGYFGSIQADWGSLTLIEACRILRGEFPRLRLLMAGHNNTGEQLSEDFITYMGSVPQSRVPILINVCDVVAMPYHLTEQVQAINPCKLAEYLACGAPIAATRVTDLPEILAACPQGLCEPGNVGALVTALRNQLLSPCRVPFPADMTWESKVGTLADNLARLIATR